MAIDNSGLVYLLDPFWQGENLNGKPLVGGYMCVYVAGTDTKYITYQNFDGTRNPFKIPLNSDGRAVIIVEAQYKYDCYLYDSFGNMVCSRLNVSPVVGGDVSVSGLTEVYHDESLSGDGTPYAPLAVVSAGKVYSGVAPIVVDNETDTISAQTASFGVESPLYLVKDDASATVIGVDQTAMENFLSGKADASALDEIRDNMMSATAIGGVNDIITGYNGSAFSAGSTYSGIAPITVDNENKTISVSSKELEAQAPLQITDVGSAYQISLKDPGALIVDYGAGTYAEIQSAVSEGRSVIAHRNAGGRDYYASLEQGAYGSYYFNCDDGNTQYTFTVNTTDTWATSSTNSLTGVSHDGTLLGSGTQSDPLGISYPLNPSDNEATATFDQYGMSAQDSEGREGHYGTTGVTLMSGTASEVVNVPSVRNWESTYDTVAVNSGLWGIEPSASEAIDLVTANSGDWNSTYNTVYAKSASWSSRPQEPVSGINIDIFESAGKVVFSGMTGGSTYTGDAQGALDEVYAHSGDWNTVTDKLDTSAQVVSAVGSASIMGGLWPPTITYLVSSINGSAVLPYGYSALSSNSANWNSTYNTVHDNSASWTGGGGGGSYTGDVQGALDEVYTKSGTWGTVTNKLDTTAQVVSAVGTTRVEYFGPLYSTPVVSSINGSAILPYGYSVLSSNSASWINTRVTVSANSANWVSTYDTVHDNSASWTGGSDFTGLFQAQYGTTTYSDIKNAVDNHKIVYCQSGGRMAFLAYSGANNYEFQYYRSLTGHTTANQGDQVFVYTVSNNNTWGVTTRNTYTEIKPSAGLTSAFTNGAGAKLTFSVSDDILNATASVAANSGTWNSATSAVSANSGIWNGKLDASAIQVVASTADATGADIIYIVTGGV